MPERQSPEALYRETMEAARAEVATLSAEIDKLRERLAQLENHREAVQDLYGAVRRLVSATGIGDAVHDPLPEYEAIGLTEEEVSLIAYPDGAPRIS
jgi:hypothetical protein